MYSCPRKDETKKFRRDKKMTSNELWKRMCGGLKFRIKWPDGINTYDYAPDLDYVVNFFDYPKGTKIYKVGEKKPLYIVG